MQQLGTLCGFIIEPAASRVLGVTIRWTWLVIRNLGENFAVCVARTPGKEFEVAVIAVFCSKADLPIVTPLDDIERNVRTYDARPPEHD